MNPIKKLKQLKRAIDVVQNFAAVPGCRIDASFHELSPMLVLAANRVNLLPGAEIRLLRAMHDFENPDRYYLRISTLPFDDNKIALFSSDFDVNSYPYNYYFKNYARNED